MRAIAFLCANRKTLQEANMRIGKSKIVDPDAMEIDASDLVITPSKPTAGSAGGESRALHKWIKRAHSEVLKAMDKGTDSTGGQPNAMQELLDLVKSPEYDA